MASEWLLQKRGGLTSTPAPISTQPAPVRQASSPVPVQPQIQETAYDSVKRKASAGLGKIADYLSRPQQAVGSGGKAGEAARKKGLSYFDQMKATGAGAWRGFTNQEQTTPGSYIADDVLDIKNPYANAGVQLATDLVADPLNVVGFLGKAKTVKSVLGGVDKMNDAFKASKIGTKLMPTIGKAKDFAGAFKYGYGLTPERLKSYEALQRQLAKAGKFAEDVASPLKFGPDGKQLPKDVQKLLGYAKKIMENNKGTPVSPEDMKILEAAEPVLKKLFSQFEDLAQEAIKYGADPEIFADTLGKYGGRRMFASTASKARSGGGIAVDTSQYLKRKNISPERLKELGEIVEPAYGAAQAAYSQKRNVEILKFFDDISNTEAITRKAFSALDDAKKAGYVLLDGSKYGRLSGKYVPKQLASYIKPIVRGTPGSVERAFEFATKIWKPIKTVLSPAQLGRNTITSEIQAFLENPKSLLRLPQAIKENVKKGKFYQALDETGELTRTSPGVELEQFVPEELAKLSGGAKAFLSKAWELVKKPGSAYQSGVETTAKLQSFIARVSDEAAKLGISVDDALKNKEIVELGRKSAEASAFNYAKVSPTVAKLRKGYVPFITYPLKAGELTLNTLKNNPARIAALQKGEQAVMNLSEENAPNEEFLPGYLNQSLRIGKPDEKGTSPYLNTKYLYPWGNLTDIASGEGEFNPFTNIGISPSPFATWAGSMLYNKDIFGNEIKDKTRFTAETFGPSFVRTGYRMADAATKNQPSPTAMKPSEIALKELGLPYYKYNPEQAKAWDTWNKKEKIEEIKKAARNYVRDYEGKKSEEEMKKQLQKYVEQIEKIQAE